MSENKDYKDEILESTERFWDATKKTFHTATFKATQYRRIVQKKIDLAALHKKISAAHADLGKLIDDYREAGRENILTVEAVQALFQRLDSLKSAAATLEEEIESIKAEFPPEEDWQEGTAPAAAPAAAEPQPAPEVKPAAKKPTTKKTSTKKPAAKKPAAKKPASKNTPEKQDD